MWVCVYVCVCSVFRNRLSTSYLECFVMVDQFATIKLLVNTHGPCQNGIVRLQKVKFSASS